MNRSLKIWAIRLSLLGCFAWTSPTQAAGTSASTPAARPLSFLHTQGLHIVNEAGERVSLRGFNLGSWLLLEPWMVKLDGQEGIAAEKDIWDQLAKRFGDDPMRAIVAEHRKTFIAESDIEDLHQLGVNFVRVPIWWRVLGDSAYDSNGWDYVDHLLDWCEARGIYALLDLHGAAGGQSTGANILGERPDGTYWGTNPVHRAAAIQWWRTVAQRYAGRGVVAGYDLLNEAWGTPSVNALTAHMDEMYRAIRDTDPRHMIFIEDALQGYYRLPNPADMHWQNVVYSFHCYPENGLVFAQRDLIGMRDAQLQYGIPIHIGEFNLYCADRGGIFGMDRCLQVFNARDWAWTLWSYKALDNDADYFWGLTGHTNAVLPWISLKDSSYGEILGYFRSFATQHWRTDPLLRACVEQRLKQAPMADEIGQTNSTELALSDAVIVAGDRDKGLKVEWQWSPPNLGFWTPGDSAAWRVVAGDPGNYRVDVRYATAADGPAVEFHLDGVSEGTWQLPTTGDWHVYRWASVPCGYLTQGNHVLRMSPGDGKEFLNLREARLVPDKTAVATADVDRVELGPAEIAGFQRKGHVCVEWQNTPPNVGHFNEGDAVVFHVSLAREGQYVPSFTWSSPSKTAHLRIEVNGAVADTVDVSGTGDWHRYEWRRGTKLVKLPAGDSELVVRAVDVDSQAGAGNLRLVRMDLAGMGSKTANRGKEAGHE